jgi:hypothetical protein
VGNTSDPSTENSFFTTERVNMQTVDLTVLRTEMKIGLRAELQAELRDELEAKLRAELQSEPSAHGLNLKNKNDSDPMISMVNSTINASNPIFDNLDVQLKTDMEQSRPQQKPPRTSSPVTTTKSDYQPKLTFSELAKFGEQYL